tara:strand:- start:641 stop:2506 length:1866 start_codon:yes stop_codon:yes gene_type:complete
MIKKKKIPQTIVVIVTKNDALKFLKSSYDNVLVITVSVEAEYILNIKNNINTKYIWSIYNYDYKKFEEETLALLKSYQFNIASSSEYYEVSHSMFYDQFFLYDNLSRKIAYFLVNHFDYANFIVFNNNNSIYHNILKGDKNYNSSLKYYLKVFLKDSSKNKTNLNILDRIYLSLTFKRICILLTTSKYILREFINIFNFFNYSNLEKNINKIDFNFITNSWGRDLSRFIDFKNFHDLCHKSNIKILNIIWNKNKLNSDSDIKSNNIYLDTDFAGIKITNFNFFNRVKIFLKIFNETQSFIHSNILINKINFYNYNFYYNYYYLIKINFINNKFADLLKNKNNCKAFISSHTDFIPILSLNKKMHNHSNVSLYPHALNFYNQPNYFNSFDTYLSHSDIESKVISSFNYFKNINFFTIGNNFYTEHNLNKSKNLNPSNLNIVIATRSSGGKWETPLFDYKLYIKNFIQLCDYLNTCKYNVTIKSHPNGDFSDFYDQLADKYEFVTHVSIGWKERVHNLSKFCDLMICFSEVPSLLVWSISERIPVIIYDNSYNKQFRDHIRYTLPDEIIACNFNKLKNELESLINDKNYLNSYLIRQSKSLTLYSKPNPEKNLVDFLNSFNSY